MKHTRVIHETDDKIHRIIEVADLCSDFDDLCGDTYDPKVNTDIPAEQLEKEKQEFLDLVNREGIYGYVLERWNPMPGCGYEHADSCFGFVGQYSDSDETFKHYIIDEFKAALAKSRGGA